MKDAIKYFKKRIDVDSKICNLRTCDAEVKEIKMRHISYMQMAIEALEKQIPIAPYRIGELDSNDNANVICPSCKSGNYTSVKSIKQIYCWECGQSIKWE